MITNEKYVTLCREADVADHAYHAALGVDQQRDDPSPRTDALKEAWYAADRRRDEATMAYATQIESVATLGGWDE
jgi:hypothetical protein